MLGLFQRAGAPRSEEREAQLTAAGHRRTKLRLLTEHEISNRSVNAAREHFLARCQAEKDRPIERKQKGSLFRDLVLCLCLGAMVFAVVGVIQYGDQLTEIWRAFIAKLDVL